MPTQGKTNNFAHPALKEAMIEFFYTGSYHIADKHPNLFRHSIPLPCLALVGAAVISSFCLQYSSVNVYFFHFSLTVCSMDSRRTAVEKPSPTSRGKCTTPFSTLCWACYTIFRRILTMARSSRPSWWSGQKKGGKLIWARPLHSLPAALTCAPGMLCRTLILPLRGTTIFKSPWID